MGAAAGGGAVAAPQLAAERLEAPARVTLERLPELEDCRSSRAAGVGR